MPNQSTRRSFLEGSAFLLSASRFAFAQSDEMSAILQRIKPLAFPDRDFDITRYGASGDGTKNCTEAIHKAVAACTSAGGGRVVVPAGQFLTGAIHLDSNVNLHVTEGATLLFSTDQALYPVVYTRWEGTECMNFSPLVYAFEKTNIAITGPGTLDGQAGRKNWWKWVGRPVPGTPNQAADRKSLVELGDKNVPVKERVFGPGHFLRPQFVQPYRCTNVLIDGLTIKNSPMWEINPVLCHNVTVSNLHIDTHGPNNDGVDPESSRDVLIEKCTFDTGDDCIAIKAGRNQDGRRVNVPCENLVIRDCNMKDGHGGVSIGSEVSGGIRNVYIENCRMDSPHLQRALRIKTNSYRGGEIANIYFRNITVGQVAEAVIEVDFHYEEGEGGPFRPVVKNVAVSGVTCQKSKYGLYMRGFQSAPISGVHISHCKFDNAAKENVLEHVQSLTLDDVTVNGKALS